MRFPEDRHWGMQVEHTYVFKLSWPEMQAITEAGEKYDAYEAVIRARDDFQPSQLATRVSPTQSE